MTREQLDALKKFSLAAAEMAYMRAKADPLSGPYCDAEVQLAVAESELEEAFFPVGCGDD